MWRPTGAEWLALLAILAVAPACDEPDPGSEVVTVVREAELTCAYRGTKRMVFGSSDSKALEYLVTHFTEPDGAVGPTVTEVVGRSTSHSRTRVDWRSRHDYWLADPEHLLANYRILADGPAEIAGRPGTRYVIRSRHEGLARPSVIVVVDERTGLMLSYRESDWRGEPSFLAEFTSLVVDPEEMPERPVREPGRKKAAGETPEQEIPDFARLIPRHLPEGFRAKGEGRFTGRSRKSFRVVYTDGLSWFEIRQWKAKEDAEAGTLRRHVKGSRVWMRMTHEGVGVALYGRLDPAELERVLRSLAEED